MQGANTVCPGDTVWDTSGCHFTSAVELFTVTLPVHKNMHTHTLSFPCSAPKVN